MQVSKFGPKKLLLSICALLTCLAPVFWPTSVGVEGQNVYGADATLGFWAQIKALAPAGQKPVDLPSLANFKKKLESEGRDLRMHGVYIETLDTREPIAAFNEDAVFNPASVMKIVTSIAALDKLGADYRFKTEFRAFGEVNAKTSELKGDLIVVSGNDPSFSLQDAAKAGATLRKLGIHRVTGNLIISGSFICNENSQTDVSAGVLRRNMGIPIRGTTVFENYDLNNVLGRPLFTIESDMLIRILQEQNAHSVNSMADAIGEVIGGAEAVREFLIDHVGLRPEEVFISRASGLETNRLTPWGTAKMLRGVLSWLRNNGYKPEDLMPVAGIDPSTVAGRFAEPDFAGSVVAKTGTLHETDNGAANLAGIAYTKDKGAILFVIYDMAEGRNVPHLRRVQDEFLKELINELGGPDPVNQKTDVAEEQALESNVIMAE